MAGAEAADALILLARLGFVALLYAFVGGILLQLGRRLVEDTRRARPGASQAVLTLLDMAPADGPAGRTVTLDGVVVIGRRPECDVVLRDDAVSGRHARIVRDRREWRVEDLGSTNGTFLNGRRISGSETVRPGDTLTTGAAEWRFDVAGT